MNPVNPKKNHKEIAVTATGMLTPAGYGLDANIDSIFEKSLTISSREGLTLSSFKPAKHLTDKRMLKAVSSSDGLGLAAIEDLKRDERFPVGKYKPEELGLFVGAQESLYHDN
jgi:3-oxoacyl-(acyl-carrier-protein) synthase